MVKLQRSNGEERRTPWRHAEYGQTSALAAGPATSLCEREGERGLGISRGRHSGRGFGAGPCSRQLEMREDAVIFARRPDHRR